MEFEFIYEPVPLIIVRNVFTKKENEEILAEAISNETNFVPAEINGNSTGNLRNNISCYYDTLYADDRTKSKLLVATTGCLQNVEIQEILSSFTYPINMIAETNSDQTVMGRYGDDEGQEYKYHADSNGHDGRLLTIVFYFNKEPKEYEGGQIEFTRSPCSSGILADKNETVVTITPENNMAVIFGAKVTHRVMPTKSPKDFGSGRFSVNCNLAKIEV